MGGCKSLGVLPLETTRFLTRRKKPPLKIQMAGGLRGTLGTSRQRVGRLQRLGVIGGHFEK